jgi:hypothetical protein
MILSRVQMREEDVGNCHATMMSLHVLKHST